MAITIDIKNDQVDKGLLCAPSAGSSQHARSRGKPNQRACFQDRLSDFNLDLRDKMKSVWQRNSNNRQYTGIGYC